MDLFLQLANMSMNDLRIKGIYRSRIFIKTTHMLFHKSIKRKDRLLSEIGYCRRIGYCRPINIVTGDMEVNPHILKFRLVVKGEKLA